MPTLFSSCSFPAPKPCFLPGTHRSNLKSRALQRKPPLGWPLHTYPKSGSITLLVRPSHLAQQSLCASSSPQFLISASLSESRSSLEAHLKSYLFLKKEKKKKKKAFVEQNPRLSTTHSFTKFLHNLVYTMYIYRHSLAVILWCKHLYDSQMTW